MLVWHDVQEREDVKNLMMRVLIAAVVLTLLLGLGGGFWMGRRILAQAGATFECWFGFAPKELPA